MLIRISSKCPGQTEVLSERGATSSSLENCSVWEWGKGIGPVQSSGVAGTIANSPPATYTGVKLGLRWLSSKVVGVEYIL